MLRTVLLLALAQLIVVQSYKFYSEGNYALEQIGHEIRNLTNSWVPTNKSIPKGFYVRGVHWERLRENRLPTGVSATLDEVDLPEAFDARERWPECPSLREVRNQGCCGSCWAVSATSAMTDRWCIHSGGKQNFNFGAYDLMACCPQCGDGCEGGELAPTWEHWVNTGIASGGEYKSGQGCRPYPFDVCVEEDQQMPHTPYCLRKCDYSYNVTTVTSDRRFGRVAYTVENDESAIMTEIFLNGPVQAAFRTYEDFSLYESGVYRHVKGRRDGAHAVKMIGWGVENGQKYWLCANSWGTHFGEDGFFKIVRGENHLGIESEVYAGMPRYKPEPKRGFFHSY